MAKHNLKTVALSLSTALLLGITGCSDSSDDSSSGGTTPPATSYSGIAIDGILMDSQVCIDENRNGICNSGETTVQTDVDGKFAFPDGSPTGPLILSGGYDKSLTDGLNLDGTPKYKMFEGVLKAPEGSSVVTPLTSAIQSVMDNNSSVSAADAEATVKTAMGLDDLTVDLTEFDPYNGIDSNNTTDVAAAQKILAKQTQLQVLVHTAAVTIAGADDNTDVNETMSHVFDALAQSMDTGAEVELDAQTVAIATRQAATKTYEDNADADAFVLAVGTVAQTKAEESVAVAKGVELSILNGAPEDAIKVLDAAIDTVNKEDGNETKVTLTAQSTLTDAERSDIITARNNEDIAAQETTEQEAVAQLAREEANKALLEAQTQTELEAAEKLRAEAATAEKLAAEKAAYEALKAQEKVAAEEAAALLSAQEAADAKAAAEAAAAAAEAAALAAEIEAEAAEEAAKAIAEADAEVDLEQLKEDAEAAALAAEQARALDLIGSYIVTAEHAVTKAADEKEEVITLATTYDFNITVAENAFASAEGNRTLLVDYNTTTPVADLNTTYAEGLKNNVLVQAAVVSDELSKIKEIESSKLLETIITENTKASIEAKIELVDGIYTELSTKLSALGTSSDLGEIETLARTYVTNTELQTIKADATTLNSEITTVTQDATDSLNTIAAKKVLLEEALNSVDEATANALADEVLAEQALFEEKLQVIETKKAELGVLLEQAKTIQASIEGVEGTSINVTNAVNTFDTFDPTKESLTTTLTEMKNTLGTENQDEKVLAALIDIAEIVNSDAVQNLIDTNSSLPNLDAFSGNSDVMVEMASTATVLGGRDLVQEIAVKLKDASAVIGEAFTNTTKVMEYGDIVINANDATLIQAGALSAAAALELVAAYDYGDISFARTQTKVIDGVTYDYIQAGIDPLALFAQATFFKMDNSDRLVDAGATLKDAATLYVSLDSAYLLEKDLNTSDTQAFLDAWNGDGLLKEPDGSAIDVKKIFSATDYIDRDDFTLPTSYTGYSADVVAEYEKAADYYGTVESYVNGGCAGTYPTADINWTLIQSAERNTSVTLDEDASILLHEPAYTVSRPISFDYYMAEQYCQFRSYGSDEYGRAEFDIVPKASFDEIVIPVKLADKFVSGATFYTHFYNGDDVFIKFELTSASEVTKTERIYYPDENGNLTSITYTYTGTYSIDANDMVTMSLVDTADATHKDTFYFQLENSWAEGLNLHVKIDNYQDGTIDNEFSKDYEFSKPDWYPADF